MENRRRVFERYGILLIIQVILFTPLLAFAGGGQHYPNGVEAQLIGVVPPPGFYIREYNYYYTATKLKDDNGHTLTLGKDGCRVRSIECLRHHPSIHLDLQTERFGRILWPASFCPVVKGGYEIGCDNPGRACTFK